jgi:uracil-DNA glycosylase
MTESAADLIPERPSLAALRKAAAGCRACPLWETGTQTVFGEGAAKAKAMFVGEQPGDQEDRQGRPFVGPAGRVLDEALELAGIERGSIYVTNAVKHFKWEARGKRRIHAKPSWSEQMACRPWLEAEIAVVQPHVLVCLGATAAQSLLGKQFRVTKERGRWLESELADRVTATIHPSAILRQRDAESRKREMQLFIEDLRLVATELEAVPGTASAVPGTKSVAPVEVAGAIDGPETGVLDLACRCRGNRVRRRRLRGLLAGPRQVHVGAVRNEVRIDSVHRLFQARLLLGLEQRVVLEGICGFVALDRHSRIEIRVPLLEFKVIPDHLSE